MPMLSVVAHHSEPTDPELLESLIHTIDSVVGQGPLVIVVAIAVLVVAFPTTLAAVAIRRRRGR
jgi:hypothetical protein